MRNTLMSAIAVLSLSVPAAAQAPESTPAMPIEISASGEGTWYVRCEIERDGAEGGLRELNKARPAYRDDHMRSAACHFESNKRGLTIKIAGTGWACPFKGAPEGDCSLTDNRGSGEFRIVRSGR